MKRILKKRFQMAGTIGLLVLACLSAAAAGYAQTTVPHTFTSGTTAKASEVNANFQALTNAINNIQLTPGPQGLQGPAGPTGATGPQGPNDIAGNLSMLNSTATVGNILKGGFPFIHNFGTDNTFIGIGAGNLTMSGTDNTASGLNALLGNTTGANNTAIGNGAIVNASNKIRLGNSLVTVIEAQVGLTVVSDRNQKEHFRPVDGEDVLRKIRGLSLLSWNFIGQAPEQFRHYGPMAQEFFSAFGRDGVGTIGTPTTITSTDMDGILMIAAQALEKRTADLEQEKERLKSENADLKARLERLERAIVEAASFTKAKEVGTALRGN